MGSPIHKPDRILTYVVIFVALLLLLVATVVAATFDLGRANTPIALAIAVVKALLVILVFMHVRHNSRLTWAFVAAGFLWLSLLLCLTMTDYMSR